MGDSRLELLREAAKEFVSARAVDASENWKSVSFRFGARAVTVSLGADDEGFTVLVDSDYEGIFRVKAVVVDNTVTDSDLGHKFLWLGELGHRSLWLGDPEYLSYDGKRYPMPPSPAYSLLALGVVVASNVVYHLYGILLNLKDCMRIAYCLLNRINESAEAPKTHNWEDDPKFLDSVVESYIYLLV
jgi:hypothetical protein